MNQGQKYIYNIHKKNLQTTWEKKKIEKPQKQHKYYSRFLHNLVVDDDYNGLYGTYQFLTSIVYSKG